MSSPSLLSKVILLGDSGVGKTNLLLFYKHKVLSVDPPKTTTLDFYTQIVEVDSKRIKAYIWDTGLYTFILSTSVYTSLQLFISYILLFLFVPLIPFS